MGRNGLKFCFFIIVTLIINTNVGFAAENLVKNPSFEQSKSLTPDSWEESIWNKEKNASKLEIIENVAHSGTKSVRITNNVPNDARFKQMIQIKQNSKYKLSCWTKTLKVGDSGKGANISVEGQLVTSNELKGTSDWVYIEVYVKTLNDIDKLNVTLGIGGYGKLNTGIAYFDDVIVEQVENIPTNTNLIMVGNTKAASDINDLAVEEDTASDIFNYVFTVIALISTGVIVSCMIYYYLKVSKKNR